MKLPKMPAGRPAAPKGVMNFTAWCGAHKKQLMISGVFLCLLFVVTIATNMVKGTFADMEAQANASLVALQNEMASFQSSDEYFTHKGQIDRDDTVQIVWNGDKIDSGRWRADDDKFWDFISPAFNFSSAVEYNKTREDYRQVLGDCLFTTQFLTAYDITAAAQQYCKQNHINPDADGNPPQYVMDEVSGRYVCQASKADFLSYPISVDGDGNYRYMGYVFIQRNNSNSKIAVVFEYTAVHTAGAGGEDNVTISDFKCWPPDRSRSFKKTNG